MLDCYVCGREDASDVTLTANATFLLYNFFFIYVTNEFSELF